MTPRGRAPCAASSFFEAGGGGGAARGYVVAMNDTDWLRKRLRNPRAGCLVLLLPGLGALLASGGLIAALGTACAALP